MLRMGIVPEVYKAPKQSHVYKGRMISSKIDCYRLLISGTQSYRFLNKPPQGKTFQETWADKNYAYLPVKHVQKVYYSGLVFNLEVEGDNSYVSVAGALHNCLQRLWFRVYGDRLLMETCWRSRDAMKAAFMNIYALTILQRRVAEELSKKTGRTITPGEYVDFSNSYHIYEPDFEKAESLVKRSREEGWETRSWSTEKFKSLVEREMRIQKASSG